MESALAQRRVLALPVGPRLDPQVGWIWVLGAALLLYLGLDGGGYDLVVRSNAAIAVWWVILLGALCGVIPAARTTTTGRIALALLAGFVVWTAIATSWALSPERSVQELSRVVCYLGVLALAVWTYPDRDRALRHATAVVACAVVVLAGLALISRLRPGTFSGAETTASFLPGEQNRLSWPLNYWNALGGLVALGIPLLLGVAGSARSLIAQALAAAAVPMVVLAGYLTFSRGGAIAAGLAAAAYIVLAPERLSKLATLAVSAGGSAILVAGAVHRHAIEQGHIGALARHQGSTLLVAVVLVCAGVGVAQVGLGLAARHGTLPRVLRITQAQARVLLVIGVVVVVVAALAAGAPHRLSHAWHQFKQPTASALHENALGRYGALSGNGRYTYWHTAVKAMPGHWLDGYGPGSFEFVWLPRASQWSYVQNAHSLYVETLAETGLVGLGLLVAFLLAVLIAALRGLARTTPERRTRAAAVAAALVAFIVGAGFDWLWQVPVLPVAALLLAAAVLVPERAAVSVRRSRRDELPTARRFGGMPGLAPRAAIVVVAAAALVLTGVPLAGTVALRSSQAAARAHNLPQALREATTAVSVESDSASARLQEALVLEQLGRYAAAADQARQATTAEPQNWQTWLVLSRIEAEQGKPRHALADYRRARHLNPRSPIFHP
jgi:hypothetical protein